MKIKRFTFMKSLFGRTLVLHPRALLYHFSAARDPHTQSEIKAVFLFHESHSQHAHLHFLTTNTVLPSDLTIHFLSQHSVKCIQKQWCGSCSCHGWSAPAAGQIQGWISSPGWNGSAHCPSILPAS